MRKQLFTIGHSTYPLDHFLALLAQQSIEAPVDIRRFPSSRKFPHFNQDDLASALREAGLDYHWLEALGGRRDRAKGESPNVGLENVGFRNYADLVIAFPHCNCPRDNVKFLDGIFQEDNAMPRKTWLPGRPKRSTVGMTWLPARPRRSSTAIPPAFKMQVEKKASQLVETVLKPRYVKPNPKKPRFNFIIDMGIKWLGSKLFFIATYACPHPTAISPTFESKFAKMEFVGSQMFNLSFMRHNGKWVELFSRLSVDECLDAIRDDYWFQLI